jgi:hypothetical protein
MLLLFSLISYQVSPAIRIFGVIRADIMICLMFILSIALGLSGSIGTLMHDSEWAEYQPEEKDDVTTFGIRPAGVMVFLWPIILVVFAVGAFFIKIVG